MKLLGMGMLISSVRGSAGGTTVRKSFGKVAAFPTRKPRLSMTEPAKFLRLAYVAVESLWNRQALAVRDAWLRGCKVQYLSGRDLFGRVNWHQLVDYDSYLKLPPDSQPEVSPRIKLAGVIPAPPEVLRILGGPLTDTTFPFSVLARQERQGLGIAWNLPAAKAAAYADIASKSWAASGWPLLGFHAMDLQNTAPFMVRVLQLRSLLRRGGDLRCYISGGVLKGTFGPGAVSLPSGGISLDGALMACQLPISSLVLVKDSPLLAAGQWWLGDANAWGPLPGWPVFGGWTGWELQALSAVDRGRG